MTIFGGIEAGGTKFICAIGAPTGAVDKKITIPTTTPKETMAKVIEFFKKNQKQNQFLAIGLASFGPIELNQASVNYGYITSSPKTEWNNFNILGVLKEIFNLPFGFDTDVNGAALGEQRFGAAKGLDTFLYITVGTGIGLGGIIDGKALHGLTHPEAGHIFIPHDKSRDPFSGICPYHKSCLEGLASGPAIKVRWQVKSALDLPDDHSAWNLEAEYLAYAIANFILSFSPQKIILGGGVMRREGLLKKVQLKTKEILNGYIKNKNILTNIENYLVAPGLQDESGICGAIALAEVAYQNSLIDRF